MWKRQCEHHIITLIQSVTQFTFFMNVMSFLSMEHGEYMVKSCSSRVLLSSSTAQNFIQKVIFFPFSVRNQGLFENPLEVLRLLQKLSGNICAWLTDVSASLPNKVHQSTLHFVQIWIFQSSCSSGKHPVIHTSVFFTDRMLRLRQQLTMNK